VYDENNQNTISTSYLSTSSNTEGNILKYRLQHLVRGDIFWKHNQLSAGISARYNSHMKNIDRAFTDLEKLPFANFQPGLTQWRENHKKGDTVLDLRIGYEIFGRHRLSVIINNALNREYAIRPLSIEEPRMTMLQYTLTL
jgi:iron complex outermembrane receptor protein